MHLLHFLPSFYYQAKENCLSFLYINQKMKVNLPIFSPHFFHLSFHPEECVMNELCLCEVAEIYFTVSNIDFVPDAL